MPGSAVPTFAVRPLVAENTATSVDENALKATTTPAIADPASHSGLATPRLVVLDDYFGSRTDMEVEYLPRPLSFPGIALFCVCDSFHPRPRLIPHHQTEHCSGAVSKFPRPEVCCSRWFPCWRFSCSSWFEMRKGRSRSTVVPPTRVTETTSASSSSRKSRTLLEGWRSDAPSGVVIRLPGTSLPGPCSFMPLITASSTRNATLPAARPSPTPTERQNRYNKKSWPTTGRFSMPPRR